MYSTDDVIEAQQTFMSNGIHIHRRGMRLPHTYSLAIVRDHSTLCSAVLAQTDALETCVCEENGDAVHDGRDQAWSVDSNAPNVQRAKSR